MAKQSEFLKRLEAKYKVREGHKIMFAMQYAEDAAMMACAEVFGMGEDRAKLFHDAFCKHVSEISRLIQSDSKDDRDIEYSRADVDRTLKQICGKHFQPWEERYGGK